MYVNSPKLGSYSPMKRFVKSRTVMAERRIVLLNSISQKYIQMFPILRLVLSLVQSRIKGTKGIFYHTLSLCGYHLFPCNDLHSKMFLELTLYSSHLLISSPFSNNYLRKYCINSYFIVVFGSISNDHGKIFSMLLS